MSGACGAVAKLPCSFEVQSGFDVCVPSALVRSENPPHLRGEDEVKPDPADVQAGFASSAKDKEIEQVGQGW